MNDNNLGEALSALGSDIVAPEVDLVGLVRSELLAPSPSTMRWGLPRVAWVPVAMAVAVVLAASLFVAPVRHVVAQLLSVGRTQVEFVEELPDIEAPGVPTVSTQTESQEQPDAETPVVPKVSHPEESLDDVLSTVGFSAVLPDRALSGAPLAWEVRGEAENEELIVTYDIGVLSQTVVGGQSTINQKQLVEGQATVEPVEVAGGFGLWIEGTHVRIRDENAELATNVLVWELDELEFRFEGAPDLETALAIANSVVSVSGGTAARSGG